MSEFGSEFEKLWDISTEGITWNDFAKRNFKSFSGKPQYTNISQVIENSNYFNLKFPIETCRITSQPDSRYNSIEKHLNSAYPVIHERVLWLYLQFMEHKIKFGNSIEKTVYNNMNIEDFIQRLLTKRCASFFGKNDKFLLISGEKGISGFVDIGTEKQKYPLILNNCLSYDEMKLSALLSVSSFTDFINDGNRQNCGEIENNKNLIETDGIIVGIIGARLSRINLMEWQEIIITKTQNLLKNGYGFSSVVTKELEKKFDFRRIFSEFYDQPSIIFDEAPLDNLRFGKAKDKSNYFDSLMMKKRYTISFDTFLLESEARAKSACKKGYLHIVGIGLGVWKSSDKQEQIFLATFEERINFLLNKLNNISHIHFSWFNSEYGKLKHGNIIKSQTHPAVGINILISKRNPASKLNLDNTLLIVSYAWDGNALPGNEFWMGMLKSTGDSATACSTLITEIHNPHINRNQVSGKNLHIASEKYGVLHISDYIDKLNIL